MAVKSVLEPYGWVRVIRYYCDRHTAYLALKEDSLNNNGSYRGSRWFKIGEFREENLREVLERGVKRQQ